MGPILSDMEPIFRTEWYMHFQRIYTPANQGASTMKHTAAGSQDVCESKEKIKKLHCRSFSTKIRVEKGLDPKGVNCMHILSSSKQECIHALQLLGGRYGVENNLSTSLSSRSIFILYSFVRVIVMK